MTQHTPRDPVIAIDGPSGAGKGSVSRAIAKALGCRYVDTGAMYRAVAWMATHEGLALDDEPALAALAERVELTGGYLLQLRPRPGGDTYTHVTQASVAYRF